MISDISFVYVKPEILRDIAHGSIKTPSLYYHSNPILRMAFWQRLRRIDELIIKHCRNRRSVIDFGGGSGVFLPTLSRRFSRVVLLDRESRDAEALVERLALPNVTIWSEDIYFTSPRETFDAEVAADVLEHFENLSRPLTYLRAALAPGGILVTSVPSENWLYQVLRLPFGIQRPEDHYHTAAEVETILEQSGFRLVERTYLPFNLSFVPLFLVSAWQAT